MKRRRLEAIVGAAARWHAGQVDRIGSLRGALATTNVELRESAQTSALPTRAIALAS